MHTHPTTPDNQTRTLGDFEVEFVADRHRAYLMTELDEHEVTLVLSPEDARWLRDRLDAFLTEHGWRTNPASEFEKRVDAFTRDVQLLTATGVPLAEAYAIVSENRARIYGTPLVQEEPA